MREKSNTSNIAGYWKEFRSKADIFMNKTQQHSLKEVNPGGHYTAIWCRDASYILKDWFLSGANVDKILGHLRLIWSHQITSEVYEEIIYGRGSPEMNFKSSVANKDIQRKFEGALPTTIYNYKRTFSEVYGQNPDIDSTALMISTTSWILDVLLREATNNSISNHKLISSSIRHPNNYSSKNLEINRSPSSSSTINAEQKDILDCLIPSLKKGIDYLKNRDIDSDALLEQDHNEDWMDTILRAGKIVYSQACWILALKNFASLLFQVEKGNDANHMIKLADESTNAVDQTLWSEEDGCYIDIQESHHIGGPYKTLTQDVSLYLVAITEDIHNHDNSQTSNRMKQRAQSTLDAIRNRLWKENWPLVTEVNLKSTGPWLLKPYFYHNHTFWPWTTGIELMARGRLGRIEECNILLSKLASADQPYPHAFHEWVNPNTRKGDGAYPFRTGVSSVRIAIADIFWRNLPRNNQSRIL
jgi:hypothetical protein